MTTTSVMHGDIYTRSIRLQPELVIMKKTRDCETAGISVLDSIVPMDDDPCLGTPERSAAVQLDVLRVYLDADGLCHDRVFKRVYKLKKLI